MLGSGALRQAWVWVRWFLEGGGGGKAYLDEVLAFGFGYEGLELRGGEGVDEAGLGDDEEEDLGAGEDGQFVSLRSSQHAHSKQQSFMRIASSNVSWV